MSAEPAVRVLRRTVITADGCWEFQGSLGSHGYGKVAVTIAPGRQQTRHAHRVVYERLRGPIPEGLVLDHLCRNRACCNPDHLEPVTNWENLRRGESLTAVNAAKTACPAGHPYDDRNTLIKHRPSTGQAYRACRACNRERKRRARHGG